MYVLLVDEQGFNYWGLSLYTMLWADDDHDVPLSCELAENMPKLLFASDVLDPENGEPKLNLFSVSELVERRGANIRS